MVARRSSFQQADGSVLVRRGLAAMGGVSSAALNTEIAQRRIRGRKNPAWAGLHQQSNSFKAQAVAAGVERARSMMAVVTVIVALPAIALMVVARTAVIVRTE